MTLRDEVQERVIGARDAAAAALCGWTAGLLMVRARELLEIQLHHTRPDAPGRAGDAMIQAAGMLMLAAEKEELKHG